MNEALVLKHDCRDGVGALSCLRVDASVLGALPSRSMLGCLMPTESPGLLLICGLGHRGETTARARAFGVVVSFCGVCRLRDLFLKPVTQASRILLINPNPKRITSSLTLPGWFCVMPGL